MAWDAEDNEGETIGLDHEGHHPSQSNLMSRWNILLAVCVMAILSSRRLRFHLKYNAFTGIYFFFGIISIPFMLFNACDPKSTRICCLLVQKIQSPLFGITTKRKGCSYPDGPFVLVCNHQSSLDCIGIIELLPSHCVILMKKLLKYAGPFGLAAILAGSIFVDRSNKHDARHCLKQAVETIQTKGYRVLVFPEGTRRLPRESSGKAKLSEPMLPFKKGAFNLAILAQVPIVPVIFSSQKHLIDFKEHKFVSGEYTGTVLPPVSTEGLTLDDAADLSDKIRSQMIECFNELEEAK